jgi:hypothetical protein
MLYGIESGKLAARDTAEAAGGTGQYIGLYPTEAAADVLVAFGFNENPLRDA